MSSSFSPRHRGAMVAGLLLAAAVVALVLVDRAAWGLVPLALLLGLGCVLLLDLRRRQQVAARAQARLADRLDDVAAQLGALDELRSILGDLGVAVRDNAATAAMTSRTVDELTSTLGDEVERAAAATETNHALLRKLDYEPTNEVQALLQLVAKVPGAPPLPGVGGWALTAASLLQIWDLIECEAPRTIVECGSGTSTVWLGYAGRGVGARVIALEHNPDYAEATRTLLERHGLSDVAEVRDAPLRDVTIGDETLSWYDTDQLIGIETVDLLLVDGPPKWTGKQARFPAVPVLRDRLPTGAVILADDAMRPDEQRAIKRWRTEYDISSPEQLSRDLIMLRCN